MFRFTFSEEAYLNRPANKKPDNLFGHPVLVGVVDEGVTLYTLAQIRL
ncbi:hypothetical protein [Spirosoma knui]